MNTATEESLARWVAKQVKDSHDSAGGGIVIKFPATSHNDGISMLMRYADYIRCKNVAGRLLIWVETTRRWEEHQGSGCATWRAMQKFKREVWIHTPVVIADIARKCGWRED